MSALERLRGALDGQPFPKVVVRSRDLRELLDATVRLCAALEGARANVATLFSVVGQPKESVQDILDRYDAALALVKDVSENGQVSSARTLTDLREEMRSKARGETA